MLNDIITNGVQILLPAIKENEYISDIAKNNITIDNIVLDNLYDSSVSIYENISGQSFLKNCLSNGTFYMNADFLKHYIINSQDFAEAINNTILNKISEND